MSSKKEKKGYGIVAIVKRKRSKVSIFSKDPRLDQQTLEQDSSDKSSVSSGPQEATAMANTEDLSRQLTEAYEDLDLAETKIEEDGKKIATLKAEIDSLRAKSSTLESKVTEMEKVSAELDDDSFSVAQEFQYKQQIEDLQEQLEKRKNLEKEMFDTKVEMQEVRAQYETIQFQKERSTTRSKMKSLSEEKSSKEEVLRLQKDLRAAERKLQQQQSTYEAQQKATQDSTQRIQDKNKALQKRCDENEKERLQLKLENGRLEKKLEKTGSYAEKKRIQTEQEAAAMELKNMQRKNAKLEKRLSMSTQMIDLIGRGSSMMLDEVDSPTSPGSSSGVTSPEPVTLSEARIMNLEKEIQQLEIRLSMTTEENQNLMSRATTAEKNVESLTMKLKKVGGELFQEKEANSSLEIEAESLRQQANTPSSSIGDDDSLQERIKQLEKEVEQNLVKFHVKEKDLWATIEAQKRQITELEMEKIVLEERLLEDDLTDVEDEEAQPKPASEANEKVQSLETELQLLREENETLRGQVDQLQTEAADIMQSLEKELGDVTDSYQDELLKEVNTELKRNLEERTGQYADTIHEIARLKNIIEDQDNEITIMRATESYHEQTGGMGKSNGTVKQEESSKKRSMKITASKQDGPASPKHKKAPATKKKPKKKSGE